MIIPDPSTTPWELWASTVSSQLPMFVYPGGEEDWKRFAVEASYLSPLSNTGQLSLSEFSSWREWASRLALIVPTGV